MTETKLASRAKARRPGLQHRTIGTGASGGRRPRPATPAQKAPRPDRFDRRNRQVVRSCTTRARAQSSRFRACSMRQYGPLLDPRGTPRIPGCGLGPALSRRPRRLRARTKGRASAAATGVSAAGPLAATSSRRGIRGTGPYRPPRSSAAAPSKRGRQRGGIHLRASASPARALRRRATGDCRSRARPPIPPTQAALRDPKSDLGLAATRKAARRLFWRSPIGEADRLVLLAGLEQQRQEQSKDQAGLATAPGSRPLPPPEGQLGRRPSATNGYCASELHRVLSYVSDTSAR